MNVNVDLERRLSDHYESEAPGRAPDWVLRSVLDAIPSTPQRRVLLLVPRRIATMNRIAALGAAAVLVIALAGVALWGGGASNVAPSPSPTATTAPSQQASPPGVTPGPTQVRNGEFRQPFTYVLPSEVEWDVPDGLFNYQEFRIPAANDAGQATGVIFQAIGDGHEDPCHADSAVRDLSGDPAEVSAYLDTVERLETLEGSASAFADGIDGRPGFRRIITILESTADCPDLALWTEGQDFADVIPVGLPVRLSVFEVGGEAIAMIEYGFESAWAANIQDLIETIRFERP
jgi:hypothetical protein